jgi:plastocyanin
VERRPRQQSNPSPATPQAVAAVTEATVTIADMAFQPHTLVVATGATVTWKNEDSAAHTVTSGEGWFDSGQLAAGESFAHQFAAPGTFRYTCNNHATMEAVVIVLPGGAVAPALFDGKEARRGLSR